MRKTDYQRLQGLSVREALQSLAEANEIRVIEHRQLMNPECPEHVVRNVCRWQAERKLRLVHIDGYQRNNRLCNPVLP